MFSEFKWSAKLITSLLIIGFVFTIICLNMSENPTPNQAVIVPGAEFIMYGVSLIMVALFIGKIRNGLFFSFDSSFLPNFFETYLALIGVSIFLSPFLAIFFKFLKLLINNL